MVVVDGMVHPDYRRRGVITDLMSHGCRRWIERGVSFGVVLPNEQWGSRVRVFGWEPLFPLRWRSLMLRPAAAMARRTGVRSLARLTAVDALWRSFHGRGLQPERAVSLRPMTEAGPELDELWLGARSGVRASLVRDRAWVVWRYFAPPAAEFHVLLAERNAEPVGYVAYRLIEDAGASWATLADVFADPRDPGLADSLLAHAVRHLTEIGVESVAGAAIPDTSFDRALDRAGFRISRGSFDVHVVRYQAGIPRDTLADPQLWTLALGDFDVV